MRSVARDAAKTPGARPLHCQRQARPSRSCQGQAASPRGGLPGPGHLPASKGPILGRWVLGGHVTSQGQPTRPPPHVRGARPGPGPGTSHARGARPRPSCGHLSVCPPARPAQPSRSARRRACAPGPQGPAQSRAEQSNPSVSERLSEMKVGSPGSEARPSKNAPSSQTGKRAGRGGGGARGEARPRPRLEFRPAASRPAPRAAPPTPLPLPFLAGKGRACLGITPRLRRGLPLSAAPPPGPGPTFSHAAVFHSLLPVPRASSPGSRCRPAAHPTLSPIH